jgi:hypothetical protein
MNAIAPITVRPIVRPQYMNAPVTLETFQRWFIANCTALRRFWQELQECTGAQETTGEFLEWAQCQYDIAKKSHASTDTANKSLSHGQEDVPHAGLGSVETGISAKGDREVTCRARYYDAASRILEDELGMHTHANADELGHVIQKWIEETRENLEPRS